MSLRGALVDYAHAVTMTAGARNAYGEIAQTPTNGPQFRCRVGTFDPQERMQAGDIEFTQYAAEARCICGVDAEDGTTLAFDASDRIVVETGPFAGTYDVVGKPMPIRKKRKQIGWQFDLKETTGKDA